MNTFHKTFPEKKMKNVQVQKFHRLLSQGFSSNEIEVLAISSSGLNKEITNKFLYSIKNDSDNKVKFKYITYFRIKFLRYLWNLLSGFVLTFRYSINKNTVIICDVLNNSVSLGAIIASKFTRTKVIGIVTDIPDQETKKIFKLIFNILTKNLNSFIFLTNEMSGLINTKKKKFEVIEGMVDYEFVKLPQLKKYESFVVHYAGLLDKKYGINNLIEAFKLINNKSIELHVYGSGDYAEKLVEITNSYPNIKYFGLRRNEFVVNEQIKSSLLINPRPSYLEFTKYSFPSKLMEYLVSGTPVLTTKLPGITPDYFDHFYFIEDETASGISNKVIEIFNLEKKSMFTKGKNAREFVLKNKNNYVQAKRIKDKLL